MSVPPAASPVLRPRRTRFIELLRTTPARTVCPNFYLLAHANGCAFRPHCDYCYLKGSLWHVPVDSVFDNVTRMLADVRRWIARDDLETYVLNAGNLSDSLSFERVRPAARVMYHQACTLSVAKSDVSVWAEEAPSEELRNQTSRSRTANDPPATNSSRRDLSIWRSSMDFFFASSGYDEFIRSLRSVEACQPIDRPHQLRGREHQVEEVGRLALRR